MKAFMINTALSYSTVLAINSNAFVRLDSSGIRGNHYGRKRILRSGGMDSSEGKELQMMVAPKEIDVDPLSTYNEQYMALVSSPCRPEYDGFFGATSGDPVHIQYGFKVEVQPLSAIMDILDIIEDKIVDSILQSSFPSMCGLQRTRRTNDSSETPLTGFKHKNIGAKSITLSSDQERLLAHIDGHPSGFRFLKFEEAEKCLPKENEVNFCGIFTGEIHVYGKHQEEEETPHAIMSYIKEVLDTTEPLDLHSELTSLSSVDKFSAIKRGGTDRPLIVPRYTSDGLSRLDILLIIISGLIVAAIIYYIYIQWNERRRDESEGDDNSEDKFVDEDLQLEPYQDNRKNICAHS